jgi:hypothetical protein
MSEQATVMALKQGDTVAFTDGSKWVKATVQHVTKCYIWVNGIKFAKQDAWPGGKGIESKEIAVAKYHAGYQMHIDGPEFYKVEREQTKEEIESWQRWNDMMASQAQANWEGWKRANPHDRS